MQITTSNGTVLDDTLLASHSTNGYIKSKNVKNLRCFVATHPDGVQEYVLVDTQKSEIVYASQQLEAIGIRVDLIAFDENGTATP